VAEFVPVEPFDIIIFGVTGDLSRLKLLPALFHRFLDNQIDESSRIIGVSRSKLDQSDFSALVREACLQATRVNFETNQLDKFLSLLKYFQMDATKADANWASVAGTLAPDDRPVIF